MKRRDRTIVWMANGLLRLASPSYRTGVRDLIQDGVKYRADAVNSRLAELRRETEKWADEIEAARKRHGTEGGER